MRRPTREDLNTEKEEEAFLAAIVEDADQNTARLVYADWLEENGDTARSSYLRLEMESHEVLRTDEYLPEELRLRLLDESLQLGLAWTALVTRARIEGCRQQDKTCPGRWELIQQTAFLNERKCEICSMVVKCQYTIWLGARFDAPVVVDPSAKRRATES
ncbi:MAG: TIGR02996 domain-containing protein [Planctomycetes bacterium]|nr:TIGR02996 domain-containing protein [Planctomycetota bacterium]